MKLVSTDNKLKPKGHYSQALVHNGIVYVSGQLPVDPDTGEIEKGSIENQTMRVLKNIEIILNEAGSSKNQILKVNIYIPDIKLWDKVNSVYSSFFSEHRPARTMVPTRELHLGVSIEIDVIAAAE